MRVSRVGLLVTLVVLVPIVIEMRTVFVHLGIDVSLVETGLIGVALFGAIVLWAIVPEFGSNGDRAASDTENTHDRSK